MNTIQSTTFPTLSFFNKVILDSLGLWGGEIIDVEFDIMATEEERRKALNIVFKNHKKEDGSFGPFSSILKSMEDTAPQGNTLQRRTRTIQDLVQHFAKEDFHSSYELEELEPYIEGVIKEKFNDPILNEFIINTRCSLIEHYKEFVREFTPSNTKVMDSYKLFVTNVAVEVICKSLFSKLLRSCSLEELNSAVIVYNCEKEKHTQWPLKAYFDELLKNSQVSAYKLHQFHELKLNNSNLSDDDIWKNINPADLPNTKSKQIVARFNRKNKMNWNKIWQQISPLTSLLSINTETFKLNSFAAQWIHNLAINLTPDKQGVNTSEELLRNIYKNIEYSKEKYLVKSHAINLQPITDFVDELMNFKHHEPSLELSDILSFFEGKQTKFLSWLAKSKYYKSLELSEDFMHFWTIFSDEKCDLNKLRMTLEKTYMKASIGWVKHWSKAREAILNGSMEDALSHYKSALSQSKYISGAYFKLLYIDICAFSGMSHQYFSNKGAEDIFERFYDELGSQAVEYSRLLGYIPKVKRDAKSLLPYSTNPFKEGAILNFIQLTMVRMKTLQSTD